MNVQKKESTADTAPTFKERIMTLLDDLYIGEKTYSKLTEKLINTVKVFIVSSRKFIADDCLTKSSSIAYTTIISLIPTLTVALTFFSIFSGVGDKKEELFRRITLFMLEHNIKLNIDPILEAISGLIENAGKIGGIGAIIMIFTATAVLRTLEKSLNDIWQVQKRRPLLLKLIYYWAALTLGPIMLIAGTTVATHVTTVFSSPNYHAAYLTPQNRLWVVGNKSEILYSKKGDLRFYRISARNIDFDNQRVMQYDAENRVFMELEFRIEQEDFKKFTFTDIQFKGSSGWVVGDDGIILRSTDGGKSWLLDKWGSFRCNDIYMIDSQRGFIAANNGILLSTNDGGLYWSVVDLSGKTNNLNAISFYGKNGIIACDNGTMLFTFDGGNTWETRIINEVQKRKRFVNLNDIHFINNNVIWVACDEGMMLKSSNGGISWQVRRFLETNYYSIFFTSTSTGYIGGEKGTLLSTRNGGVTWRRMNLPTSRLNTILHKSGILWAFGDRGMIMKSENNGVNWRGIEGKSFVIFLLNFFAPFAFIWLLFLLTYILLPNIRIPFKPAAIGASFTGTIWVIFILLFIVYIKSFAKGTLAIYGALAAIPIFLLMVYASALIVLYGAEVSYTLMYPHTYLELKKKITDKRGIHIFTGISLLYYIYKNFESGKGSTALKDLMEMTAHKSEEVDFLITLFIKQGYVIENEDDTYLPANSSKHIKLADVIDLIHDISMDIPRTVQSSNNLRKFLSTLFSDMRKARKKIVGDMTLHQLIEETS